MINILVWLLTLAPIGVEAFGDYKSAKKGKKDKKGLDVLYRGIYYVGVGLILHWTKAIPQQFWQFVLLGIGSYVMFFDYLTGILFGHNPFYLGKTSQTDSFWNHIPVIAGILWRGIVFASCLTAFYDLNKIIYGNY